MAGLDAAYLEKSKRLKENFKKLIIALSVVVFLAVFWWLKLVGITVANDESICGIDEHTHIAECYVSKLICSQADGENETTEAVSESASDETETADVSEETSASAETLQAPHVHADECYEAVLECNVPEHIHTSECISDNTADVEMSADWLKSFGDIEMTDSVCDNLIAISMSQTGYEESQRNFEYDDEGNKNGYTRYGAWYGNPYGKWNAMFVSFCLHYATMDNPQTPKGTGAESLRIDWENLGAYETAQKYTPERGDIVFTDSNGDGLSDSVGIVLSYDEERLVIIKGDSNNKVETTSIDNDDSVIGYGLTGKLSVAEATEGKGSETTTEEATDEKSDGDKSIQDEITTEKSEDDDTTVTERPPIMMFGTQQTNIKYVTDLSSVIVDVNFKTEDNIEITNGSTVYVGQTYIVSLEFSEINTGDQWVQFSHDEDHFLTYQIPDNLHCEPFTSWHPISAKTENGTVEDVGEYFVDEHGYLRVRFYDDENGICFGQRYSNVDFTIEFNATVASTQSGTSTEVIFNDEIKVELNVDGGAGMTVSKTHGSYDTDNHTMEYTIRVEGTKGVVKDLVIDDQIWENHYALRDTIVVTDLDGNILDPQPTVSDHPKHNNGAEEGFSLSGFPDFAAGDGFLIRYKTQLYDNMLTNEKVEMWNGLDSTGKDSNGNNVYVWSEDWLRVELEKMEKEGKQSVLEDDYGNPVPVIEWEVEIKKDNHNLQGTVIIDTLGSGLEYYTDKEIRVKRYDEWGYRLSDTYISWNDVTVNGNTMSFALPDGYAFEIVYYTTYEDLNEGEKKHYTNSVSATINGKEETAGGEADVIGFIPNVRKSASGNDGEYVYFTIEADVPAVIKDWGNFFLTDLAAFWGYDNDEGYLYVENVPQDMVISAVTKSGQTINFTPYVEGGTTENTYRLIVPAQGDQHHSFNVLFNTSDTTFASSKWILNEDSVLTISYKLPFDAKTGTEWEGELGGDKTLENVLLDGYKMANEAYLNYTDVIRGTGTSSYEYSPIIIKDSVVNEDGTIDYTVVFNNTIPGTGGNGGYVDGKVDVAWFTDTFDERLEYVPDSLIVTGYSPWQKGLWLAKYKYTGTVNGNTIEASSKAFQFYDYNEEADQYGWNGLSGTSTFRNYYRWVNAGGKFEFTYKLRVKDEYLYTTEHSKFLLDNTAELSWDTGGSSGPVTEESEYETGLIDKHVVQENNKLDFDIHINRRALDILDGSETLIIEDTMTKTLSVYWNSIKLLYEDKNGSWIDFDSEGSAYSYTVTYDKESNKLTFVVPDELHIRIDYTTLITESGLVSVNNAVRIDGKAEVSDIIDAIFRVEEHSGGASGSLHNITLLKQDGTTDMPLPGVSFRLYGPVGDPDAVIPSGAESYITMENGKKLYYIGSYTTGDDGTVFVETQYLTLGGPYAFVENLPPVGYNFLSGPVYFYFYSPGTDSSIQTVTTMLVVENFRHGVVLPETGGTGTSGFISAGAFLMAIPIMYVIARRKKRCKGSCPCA